MTHHSYLFDPTLGTDGSVGYFTRNQCILMNLNFANAMLAARKRGEEQFTIGAVVNDSVLFPAHIDKPQLHSGIGSAAALCAEETNQHDGVSHRPTGIGGR